MSSTVGQDRYTQIGYDTQSLVSQYQAATVPHMTQDLKLGAFLHVQCVFTVEEANNIAAPT
jgi:hypothetical protein